MSARGPHAAQEDLVCAVQPVLLNAVSPFVHRANALLGNAVL